MAAADTEERPGLDEQYIAATNSSNLTLNPDKICAATHLIAAAKGGGRMGSALIHLRAEWDRTDKPRRKTEAEIVARAKELPKYKGKVDLKRARIEAMSEYNYAMRERAKRLTGRALVMGLLEDWAAARGIERDLLSPALFHWLSPECPVCTGPGKVKALEAPVLTDRKCDHCKGAGTWPRPSGAEPIHDFFKSCVAVAKRGRADMLHAK